MVRWNDCPAMTIAVDLGRKATKQTINIVFDSNDIAVIRNRCWNLHTTDNQCAIHEHPRS